jgi:ribosomal protein S18 acetylase RimI-like enzyme
VGDDLKVQTFHTALGDVQIGRDLPVAKEEIEALRHAVGWSVAGDYQRILNEGLFTVSARLDTGLVGYLQVVGSPSGDVLIHDVCVRPDLQRQGVGTRMMEIALEACKEMGPQGVNVLFERENLGFFRRFGFRIMCGGYLNGSSL